MKKAESIFIISNLVLATFAFAFMLSVIYAGDASAGSIRAPIPPPQTPVAAQNSQTPVIIQIGNTGGADAAALNSQLNDMQKTLADTDAQLKAAIDKGITTQKELDALKAQQAAAAKAVDEGDRKEQQRHPAHQAPGRTQP